MKKNNLLAFQNAERNPLKETALKVFCVFVRQDCEIFLRAEEAKDKKTLK